MSALPGLCVLSYVVVTFAYSLALKRRIFVDVAALAVLFTIRTLAGAAAVSVTLSSWFLAFAFFVFLALAILKRQSELATLRAAGRCARPGRAYAVDDYAVMAALGGACGMASVVVLALYIQNPEVRALYDRPELLWLAGLLFVTWLGRMTLLAGRGEHACDVLRVDEAVSLADELDPCPDVAVCVVGLLADQQESERDTAAAELVMRTNYSGPALLLGALARRFESRGSGVLVGVSSVAGERGRASNYVYGSAKAGFTAFLSGLRNRLASSGVHVVTVKPGFVRTRMTDGMDLPAALTATPEEVADTVFEAIRRRRDVVYVRRVWRPIMLVIRALPERVFKRLRL